MNKIEDLVKEIAPAKEERPKTYTAEVSHTDEEGVVWVRLPGAEQDTPTASTSAEVKMGDVVTVEWRNNKLYIAGNYTNPSAGVTRVRKAEQTAEKAMSDAETAQAAADSAQEAATQAITIAGDTDQHFWFTETGTDTGAHITEATQEDFLADPTNGGGNLLARSNGIAVRDGLSELATFSISGAQIKDREGNAYFYVSDLRDASGDAQIVDTFTCGGWGTTYNLSHTAKNTSYTVTLNGTAVTSGITKTTTSVTFSTAPAQNSVLVIDYTAVGETVKGYTAGIRTGTNGNPPIIGPMSFAEGYLVRAEGANSHAEGNSTAARGLNSHAEGQDSLAYGICSHAEGYDTGASGDYSHAEGYKSGVYPNARYGHAQNLGTKVQYEAQTAIGKYNYFGRDTDNFAFMIGNGTASTPSNAFTVSWDGKAIINGHSSEIGAFKSARLTTDLSVNTSTWTILCSLTLSAGTWVLVGYADFNPNATGQRVINLHTTGGANFRQIEVNAANGYTTLETTLVVKIAQDTTYFLNVWQNSGTAITMREGTDGGYTNGIRAVRIA